MPKKINRVNKLDRIFGIFAIIVLIFKLTSIVITPLNENGGS